MPPENDAMRALLAAGDEFTVRRSEIVPDSVWAEPANRSYVANLGLDDVLFSLRKIGRGSNDVSYVQFLRKAGRPAFTPREARLLHAVLSECGPLHAEGLDASVVDDVASLSPRRRIVLALLTEGLSIKQIAAELSLSFHTVNDHVKDLYRHFGVTSRAELMRRIMTGGA